MVNSGKIKKVLIFRFGAIGDVVHTSVLFRALKKFNPEVSIHYLTFKTPALLLENDPDVDKVWVADGKSYKYLAGLAKQLKEEGIDLCINLQPSIRTKVFSFLTGAKYRLTYKKTFKLHAVENFWRTAKPLFKDLTLDNSLKVYLDEKTVKKVSGLIGKSKPVIGFNMGTNPTREGRKWPPEYWKELAERLVNDYNCQIVLSGSQEDVESADELLGISPNIKSFCGKLDIAESSALLSLCDLVLSGDTGPLHIATAVGTPVIGLYGSAPISRTGPWGEGHFALNSERKCVPCNRRKCKYTKNGEKFSPCLYDVTPEMVIDIIKSNFL